MFAHCRWLAALAWLALFSVQVSEGVRITSLHVPASVEHDTNSTAILDCVYELDDSPVSLLIVKWYFDDALSPVYQWGKGMPPSDSGVLEGRVHLGHVASADPLKKHRALSIPNPTKELSGKYTCKVTTDKGVATESKPMIVYAPAKTMNLTQEKPSPTSVNVTCLVEGVYPEPQLQVFARQEGKESERRPLEKVESDASVGEDGLYDVLAHVEVSDATLDGVTVFECVMSVPNTEYSVKREVSYSSGAVLAASISAAGERTIATGVIGACLLLLKVALHR